MTRRGAWLSALLVAGAVLGCGKGEPPRELRLEVPDVITSKEPVLLQARAVQQDGTARDPGGELDFKVTPADLATLGKRGMLRQSFRPWRAYKRPDFHPSQQDASASERWLADNRAQYTPVGTAA